MVPFGFFQSLPCGSGTVVSSLNMPFCVLQNMQAKVSAEFGWLAATPFGLPVACHGSLGAPRPRATGSCQISGAAKAYVSPSGCQGRLAALCWCTCWGQLHA